MEGGSAIIVLLLCCRNGWHHRSSLGPPWPSIRTPRYAVRSESDSALRAQAGISSQEELAARAGVHRTYVGRLERGESGVTVEALAAILAPMGISLGEFFSRFSAPVRVRTPRRRG